MVKKGIIVVCGFILILCIYLGIIAIHNATTATSGIADKTGNVNVMLTRPENWVKLVETPVIREEDMALVDGSTATIPITALILKTRRRIIFNDSKGFHLSIRHRKE